MEPTEHQGAFVSDAAAAANLAAGSSSAAGGTDQAEAAAAAAGSKRKSLEPMETPQVFKKPEPKDFLRPPLLTVDTSQCDTDHPMIDEPVVPRTPANVRSMQRTELHAAACAGNVAECRRLLNEEKHPVDPQEEHGFSPLHNAAALPGSDKQAPRLELVTLLLSHSADACLADNDGYTALHWAAVNGHAEVSMSSAVHVHACTNRCRDIRWTHWSLG